MPKNQTTLNSFFGGNPPPKKKNPQTKLDSFFGKKKEAAAGDPNAPDTVEQGKENNQNKRPNESLEADAIKNPPSANDSPTNDKEANKPKKTKLSAVMQRGRRVIDDDSDSDEEMPDANESTPKPETPAALSNDNKNDEKEDDETDYVEAKSPAKAKKTTSSVKDESAAKRESSVAVSKKDEAASSPTGGKVVKQASKDDATAPAMAESTKAPKTSDPSSASSSSSGLEYSDVCEAFEKIEAITARLQIQEIVTNLFREQIDSGKPENLYPLMYLCSNSVAPAYECVELGIGDAILIKAIAEAYGTNAAAVKQKYEDLGDLGVVAQSFKGKQKTLGGFFRTKTPAKKPLDCQEILTTFREIANMKGNQSQKFKMDKIKRMLVRVTHSAEPKYIIRALQGKLRIGLAQSTVLISLAHALTLSVPPEAAKQQAKYTKDNMAEMIADFPEEAKEYCNKKMPQDKRMEAAVAIIKKAYSEVPSFDALINAAVAVPLQELHKACTLTPGVPVAPMLAKPTKSILEVLKRLSGQRFTCEFKYDGERVRAPTTDVLLMIVIVY